MSGRCLRGHLGRCEWSVDWRGAQGMPAKGPTQVIVETVGAGARSQSASAICSGGVSAVMGSSDSWPHSPPAKAVLPSVDSRIAFIGKISNSENRLPRFGAVCRTTNGERIRMACTDCAELKGRGPRAPAGHVGSRPTSAPGHVDHNLFEAKQKPHLIAWGLLCSKRGLRNQQHSQLLQH